VRVMGVFFSSLLFYSILSIMGCVHFYFLLSLSFFRTCVAEVFFYFLLSLSYILRELGRHDWFC